MLALVKTVGEPNGAPHKCKGCGSAIFKKTKIAYHCVSCGQYYPAQLQTSPDRINLQRNLEGLSDARKKLKGMIFELEKLVKS